MADTTVTCKQTGENFQVTDSDRTLSSKLAPSFGGETFTFPDPDITPLARELKRLSFRNEKTLYQRQCSLTGKNIISTYHQDVPFPVYSQEAFWGDKWNALEYGRDFDFTKPFFQQFGELMQVVPRLALVNKQSENSEFCNYSFANKNCYLLFGCHYEEDCMYGRYSTKNKNCMEYYWLYNSELCYKCIFCDKCYNSVNLERCSTSDNCYFCFDLKGCSDCVFCHNLRNKQYHIFNKPYSKEDYEKYINDLKLGSYKAFQDLKEKWENYKKENAIYKAVYQVNCENCEGSDLKNSKNLKFCFTAEECEDCANGFQMDKTYTSIDNSHTGYDRCELAYETIGCNGIFHCVVCDSCWHSSELIYCNLCFSSKNCLGCVGLHQKEYCIFNKQYTKEQYEELAPKIIKHMQSTGEWGHFFPYEIHPYGYNETVAQEYFTLTKEQVLQRGWKWEDEQEKLKGDPNYIIPDKINEVTDDILNQNLVCEATGKIYKINPQELKFYKSLNVPVPRICPDQKFLDMRSLSSQFRLYDRICVNKGERVKSAFPPNGPKQIYCEGCYLETVY